MQKIILVWTIDLIYVPTLFVPNLNQGLLALREIHFTEIIIQSFLSSALCKY